MFRPVGVESFQSQQCHWRSRLHSKRCLRVVKPFLTQFSSLGSFLFLDEIPAWPFFGKPFFGTRQYCSRRCRRLEADFRCPVDRTVQGDEHRKVNCNFRLEFWCICARFGGKQSRLCTALVPDLQEIVPKGLQKPGARGMSYRPRKPTVSQMTSIDIIRGAASFSMTSIDVIRGQRVNA